MSRARHAKGGSVGKKTVFAGAGSPEMKEATSTSSGFKRGGRAGGKAMGKKSGKRLDRQGRAAGGPVMSSASKTSGPVQGGSGQGKESATGTGADVS